MNKNISMNKQQFPFFRKLALGFPNTPTCLLTCQQDVASTPVQTRSIACPDIQLYSLSDPVNDAPTHVTFQPYDPSVSHSALRCGGFWVICRPHVQRRVLPAILHGRDSTVVRRAHFQGCFLDHLLCCVAP